MIEIGQAPVVLSREIDGFALNRIQLKNNFKFIIIISQRIKFSLFSKKIQCKKYVIHMFNTKF